MSTELPRAALPAWRAYLEMSESKQAHFGVLSALEAKRERGEPQSLAESAHLESLLRAHDERVSRFRARVASLKDSDTEAYRALISHITLLNAGGANPNGR